MNGDIKIRFLQIRMVNYSDSEAEANDKLYGAAPRLFDALEIMLKRFEPETHDSSGCMFKNCELCQAAAAINAAKGDET